MFAFLNEAATEARAVLLFFVLHLFLDIISSRNFSRAWKNGTYPSIETLFLEVNSNAWSGAERLMERVAEVSKKKNIVYFINYFLQCIRRNYTTLQECEVRSKRELCAFLTKSNLYFICMYTNVGSFVSGKSSQL
jgi:hypothetical protein